MKFWLKLEVRSEDYRTSLVSLIKKKKSVRNETNKGDVTAIFLEVSVSTNTHRWIRIPFLSISYLSLIVFLVFVWIELLDCDFLLCGFLIWSYHWIRYREEILRKLKKNHFHLHFSLVQRKLHRLLSRLWIITHRMTKERRQYWKDRYYV